MVKTDLIPWATTEKSPKSSEDAWAALLEDRVNDMLIDSYMDQVVPEVILLSKEGFKASLNWASAIPTTSGHCLNSPFGSHIPIRPSRLVEGGEVRFAELKDLYE